MSSRNRKYDSGAEKRKKRKRLEAVAQSQKGALDKFFLRETPNANIEDDISDDMAEVDANIPVTVASAERSFSKLKLLKSYLRSTMTQERLNGLATIALEKDILEKINYEDIIEDFISRNTRRMMLFSRS